MRTEILEKSVVEEVQPFLEGESRRSKSAKAVDVINPSNGRICARIPIGCEEDAGLAVTSARTAFDDGRWCEAAPSHRKKVLHRFADLVADQASALDRLDAEEMGKPVSERLFDASAAALRLRFCAEAVDKVMGDVLTSDRNSVVAQRRVPRGVIAAVTPWNFPTFNAVLKAGPALAAGNSIVLKPSELSSRSAVRLAILAIEAGLPPGTLNVVPGLGETVGRALGLHSDVDMLTFTGSTNVGKRMLQYSGESNLKVVMAECGGKSPHIVFARDIDLDTVAGAIAKFLLTNQGQICSLGSRLLVQNEIHEEMTERVRNKLDGFVIGDALDPMTTFGPLVSSKQCERVLKFIEEATSDGARLAWGGKQVMVESGGFFVEPTIFSDVRPASRIAQEEIFGPVLSVIPFKTELDAIRIANSTSYGLAAYVWTSDVSRGMRMAKGIRSSVRINAALPGGEGPGHAYSSEPARESGIGAEGGLAGVESYMRRQTVWISHS